MASCASEPKSVVVASLLAGAEHSEKRMMKIVAPLRINAKPPASRGVTKRGSFKSLSAIKHELPRETCLERFDLDGKLLEKMDC